MTNKERLIAFVGFSPPTNSVDAELIDAGITGSSDYAASSRKVLLKSALNLLNLLYSTPNTTNENGYSVTYDRSALQKQMDWVKDELKLLQKSTIRALHMN